MPIWCGNAIADAHSPASSEISYNLDYLPTPNKFNSKASSYFSNSGNYWV